MMFNEKHGIIETYEGCEMYNDVKKYTGDNFKHVKVCGVLSGNYCTNANEEHYIAIVFKEPHNHINLLGRKIILKRKERVEHITFTEFYQSIASINRKINIDKILNQ